MITSTSPFSVIPQLRRDGEDGGFALITVIGTMSVLMLLVLGATTFAAANVPTSRRSQDYAAAMAAAQSGAEDFLARLNTCDTFWASPCAGSPAEVARGTWTTVPGSTGSIKAQYKYDVLSTPTTTPGLIRLKASGRVNGVTRSVTVDLKKEGFLKYIYYTDYEALAPGVTTAIYGSSFPGTSSSSTYNFNGGKAYLTVTSGLDLESAQACARHYYADTPGAGVRGRPMNKQTVYWKKGGVEQTPVVTYSELKSPPPESASGPTCDINFVSGDTIRGPLYTNDAMLLSGNPTFVSGAETHWLTTNDPANDLVSPWRENGAGSAPNLTGGQTVTIAKSQVNMPPTNADLRKNVDLVAHTGCLYQGPTRIVLNSSGTMDVTSPTTTSTNPNCVGTGKPLPSNGVIYVDPYTGACTGNGKALQTYPISGDITSYDCKAGDVFIEGTLHGRLTVGSAGNIVVTDDLKYSKQVWTGSTIDTSVDDVLGLVAQGFVQVYHPVTSSSGELADAQVRDLEIDAAILSVSNSFTVQNFTRGSSLGTLHMRGGIYQRFRGPVGTSGNTGYLKDYIYDSRLVSLPPPSFLEPASSPWVIRGLSE